MKTIRLVFEPDEIGALVTLTRGATKHQALPGRRVESGLFLVKDEGVYLMSSSKGQTINPKTGTLPVAYAVGTHVQVTGGAWYGAEWQPTETPPRS